MEELQEENTAKLAVPHSHIPYGPEGTGAYTKSQTTVRLAAQESIPIVLDALMSMDIDPHNTFTIANYGAADGGVEMPLLYEVVQYLRKEYGPHLPIHVSFEDQPVNDFKSTFLMLEGLLPGQDDKNFHKDFPNTFVSACGTSFYKQCYPPLSVHVGYCSTAVHWLQKKPCNLPNATMHQFETDEKSVQLFATQAAKDWELFLLQRAKELVPGGHLVVTILSPKVKAADFLVRTLKALLEDGTITQDEFINITVAAYYRTLDEVKAPFEEETSPVRRAGLTMVSIQEKFFECQLFTRLTEEAGDVKDFAQGAVSGLRAWSNSTLLSGLADTRSPQEKADIVDKFYDNYEQEVAKDPRLLKSYYSHIYVHISKVK